MDTDLKNSQFRIGFSQDCEVESLFLFKWTFLKFKMLLWKHVLWKCCLQLTYSGVFASKFSCTSAKKLKKLYNWKMSLSLFLRSVLWKIPFVDLKSWHKKYSAKIVFGSMFFKFKSRMIHSKVIKNYDSQSKLYFYSRDLC